MKGRIATSTTIKLVIVVIVIGVALWFLTQIFNLDFLFPNDQRTLKQYSTCALAYCAAGADSDEVHAVGCLKREGGECVLSCSQVEEKIFKLGTEDFIKESYIDLAGRRHYCGREHKISFEFEGVIFGNSVPLRSGEMDRIATSPWWVCKSLTIPGVNFQIDELAPNIAGLSSSELQYFGGVFGTPIRFRENCVMLSKAIPDVQAYGRILIFIGILASTKGLGSSAALGTATGATAGFSFGGLDSPYAISGLKTRGGCFTGYVYDNVNDEINPREDILYTPIIQYKTGREYQKVYPSAIYVDESFTQSTFGPTPECTFANQRLASIRNSFSYKPGDDNRLVQEKIENYVKEHNNDYLDELKKQNGIVKTEEERLNRIRADAVKSVYQEIGEDPIIGLEIYGPFINQFEYGNILNECKFRAIDNRGNKITYYVWGSPTFPGIGTLNSWTELGYDKTEGEVVIPDIEGEEHVVDVSEEKISRFSGDAPKIENFFEFKEIFQFIEDTFFESKREATEQFSALAGSCAYITLDRELKESGLGEDTTSGPTPLQGTVSFTGSVIGADDKDRQRFLVEDGGVYEIEVITPDCEAGSAGPVVNIVTRIGGEYYYDRESTSSCSGYTYNAPMKTEDPERLIEVESFGGWTGEYEITITRTGGQVANPPTISVELDKSEYSAGENVVISGTVDNFGDEREVRIDLTNTRISFTLPVRATIGSDGSFVNNEFVVNEGLASGTVFEVVAEYEDVKSEVKEFRIK